MFPGIFTGFCSHHHHLNLKHFVTPKQTLHTHKQLVPIFCSPQLQAATNLLILSVSMELTVLDIISKWNHNICALWCLWLLCFRIIFSSFIYVAACGNTIFLVTISTVWMDIPYFIYSFISCWAFSLFLLVGSYE